MPRTPNPMTAIKRMRAELDKLETQLVHRAGTKEMRATSRRPAKRSQVCGKCGKTGHNARGHRSAAKRRSRQ